MPQRRKPAVAPAVLINPNDQYLHDIPTAAAKMSTTIFAVRNLMRTGELKYVAIGHKWLCSPEAIREFIRKREEEVA